MPQPNIENPYQPTGEMLPPAHSPRVYAFKSTTTLTDALSALLVLCAILTAVIGILDLVAYSTIPGYASGDFELEGNAQAITIAMVALAIGSMLVYIICAVVFCVWMHRSCANAHSFGAEGMKYTPGWAVGYWFIPFLNLFRPYQTMCEIYRASDSDQIDWKKLEVPGFFLGWWLCWVIGNMVSRIETRAAIRGMDLGSAALPISVSSSLLSIAAAILAVMVIRQVSRVQETRAGSSQSADANLLAI